MLDPELHAVLEGALDLTAAFEAELDHTSLMRSITTPARPLGRAWAVTASMYTSSAFADGRALLVGGRGLVRRPDVVLRGEESAGVGVAGGGGGGEHGDSHTGDGRDGG